MSELPRGWKSTTLGEVISIRNGFAIKSQAFVNSGVQVVRQSNLTGSVVDMSECKFVPKNYAKGLERFLIKKGDILIGMSGSLGEPSVYMEDSLALQNQRTGLVEFKIGDDAHRNFIRYFFILSENLLFAKGKGLGVQNISSRDIESIEIALPPLPEQRRIVTKLDSLAGRTVRAREELERISKLIQKYREAILAAAFSGELTQEWRHENGLKVSPTSSLGGLVSDIRYGTSKKCHAGGNGIAVLRIPNVLAGKIDLSDLKYPSLSQKS